MDHEKWSFVSVPPGFAIVDPGAGQDLIGLASYRKFEIEEPPTCPAGIGGKAKISSFVSLFPQRTSRDNQVDNFA